MAPLADAVRPPYRPEPGRGRGRPPGREVEDDIPCPPPALPPLTPVERRAFDYSDVEHDMAQLDRVVRQTKRVLDTLARPTIESAVLTRQSAEVSPPTTEPEARIDHMEPNV